MKATCSRFLTFKMRSPYGATGNYYAGAASSNPTDGIRYAAHGAVSAMKLGNGLWKVMQYNSRLQAEWIKVGTTDGGADRWQLEYGYGTAGQNNGNLRSQTITVPSIGTANIDRAIRVQSTTTKPDSISCRLGISAARRDALPLPTRCSRPALFMRRRRGIVTLTV